jgi:hypothetical protein
MHAAHRHRVLAISVDHGAAAHHHFRRDGRNHGRGFADGLDVRAFQQYAAPGAFAARLRGGAAAKDQHQILSLRAERFEQRAVKAIAIPVQNHKTRYAPGQADRSQDAALPIEAQRLRRLPADGPGGHASPRGKNAPTNGVMAA